MKSDYRHRITQRQFERMRTLREQGLAYSTIATRIGCCSKIVELMLRGKRKWINENHA